MKFFAEALIWIALIGSVTYCTINVDNNRHEKEMWCYNHNKKITMGGSCE